MSDRAELTAVLAEVVSLLGQPGTDTGMSRSELDELRFQLRGMRGVMTGGRWRLRRGDDIVAGLVVARSDFPRLHTAVEPGQGSSELRPLFAGELRLLNHLNDDMPAWEAARSRIRDAVKPARPDGHRGPEFLLHIDGAQAWWRWSDEPFPAEP